MRSSDKRFARQQCFSLPSSFHETSASKSIDHHLSGRITITLCANSDEPSRQIVLQDILPRSIFIAFTIDWGFYPRLSQQQYTPRSVFQDEPVLRNCQDRSPQVHFHASGLPAQRQVTNFSIFFLNQQDETSHQYYSSQKQIVGKSASGSLSLSFQSAFKLSLKVLVRQRSAVRIQPWMEHTTHNPILMPEYRTRKSIASNSKTNVKGQLPLLPRLPTCFVNPYRIGTQRLDIAISYKKTASEMG